MPSIWKHRTMGRTTDKIPNVNGTYLVDINGGKYRVGKEVIDDFPEDREEVVEKDWIDNCIFELQQWCESSGHRKIQKNVLRKHIEKHAPKQKMFTRADVSIWRQNTGVEEKIVSCWSFEDGVVSFLEKHNLLSSDK